MSADPSLDTQISQFSSPVVPTDRALVEALREGDVKALGLLYDRYIGLVYGLALRVLQQPQEAEDLAQDIFLMIWRGSSYNPDRGSLGTYLTILTRSRAIDRLRSRGSASRLMRRWRQLVPSDLQLDLTFENMLVGERAHEVRQALTTLSADQQDVLTLAYYSGLTQAEIAEKLNLPLGTVKTRTRRGLLKLKEALTHSEEHT